MKGILNVLRQVFVVRYYRINAGFFLLVFLLLFGITTPKESLDFHYRVMQEITHSPALFSIAATIWIFYGLKCALFSLQVLGDPHHSFLAELQGARRKVQYGALLYCQVLMYLPALVYALATAVISLREGCTGMAFLILGVPVLLCGATALLYRRRLNHAAPESRLAGWSAALQRRQDRPRRFLLYLASYSLQYRKTTLLTLKACSLVLLQLMISLNRERLQPEGTYFFMVLIITAHALLPFYYVQFTEEDGWLRNLPVRRIHWALYYTGTYALLFLPELLFLLLHTHRALPLSAVASLYLLAVAQLSFFTAVLYIPRLPIDRYTLVVFATFLLTMLLLAAIGIWAVSGLAACLAGLLFFSCFYRYEAAE